MLCIAKAYGDEPLMRIAIAAKGGLIYILNPSVYKPNEPDDGSGVGFPAESVFEWNEELYSQLREAFERDDREGLWARWRFATPLQFGERSRVTA